MPSRQQYTAFVASALKPHLTDRTTAWQGLYKLLLWFEHGLPHIIDANELRRPAWSSRALAVKNAIARNFGCDPDDLADKVDLLLKSDLFLRGTQRQNPLGIGFVESLLLLLQSFSSSSYSFLPEGAIGETVFPEIRAREAPRSKPDIVVVSGKAEVALVSAKLSLRHDRLKDLKDECAYFKTLRPRLKFYAVTNEYSPSRLDKVLAEYRVDAVFHVCKRLVVDVARVDGRTQQLRDLSELLSLFTD
jgi:hypothetical protein